LHQLVDEAFGAGFSIHVGLEVRQLRARFEKLTQGLDLPSDGCGGEVVDAFESDVDHQLARLAERVGDGEGDARLNGLHALVEVVDVDVEEFPIGHRGGRHGRFAGKISEHAHHEGQFDLFLRPVDFHVVFDLDARGPVSGDELLAAVIAHVYLGTMGMN
jgi:hypothetical protein